MSYPPPDHVLRDLALEVEGRPDGTATGWLPVTPAVLAPDGRVEPGALAILVDVIGGGLSIRSVLPNWVATADLTLQLVDTHVVAGDVVEATAAVVRKGRTTLVVELDLHAAGAAVGWGSMTCAVLPRRDDTPAWPDPSEEVTRTAFASDGSGFRVPLVDALGARVVEAGVVELPWSEYVRNSFGALQGGVVAMLGALAGRSALGQDTPVLDLHVAYVAQARTGPFVARAEVLGPGAATVRIVDGDRLTSVAHVRAAA